jgi:hypothetical protein
VRRMLRPMCASPDRPRFLFFQIVLSGVLFSGEPERYLNRRDGCVQRSNAAPMGALTAQVCSAPIARLTPERARRASAADSRDVCKRGVQDLPGLLDAKLQAPRWRSAACVSDDRLVGDQELVVAKGQREEIDADCRNDRRIVEVCTRDRSSRNGSGRFESRDSAASGEPPVGFRSGLPVAVVGDVGDLELHFSPNYREPRTLAAGPSGAK